MASKHTADPPLVVALNGIVYGVDVASGDERWRHKLKSGVVRVAFAPGVVYLCDRSQVLCVEQHSGQVRWKVARKFRGRSTIIVQDERIYVANLGNVECLNSEGERLWTNGLKGGGYGAVAMGFPGNFAQADISEG